MVGQPITGTSKRMSCPGLLTSRPLGLALRKCALHVQFGLRSVLAIASTATQALVANHYYLSDVHPGDLPRDAVAHR